MSTHLDPSEVLKCLNQLGYCNITKEQLKDFIRDLKKLLKYDVTQFEVGPDSKPRTLDKQHLQTKLSRSRPSTFSINKPRTPATSEPKLCRKLKPVSGKVSQPLLPSETLGYCAVPCNTRASSYKNEDYGISNSRRTHKNLPDKENRPIESHEQQSKENLSTSYGTSNTSSESDSDTSSSSGSRSSKHCLLEPKGARITEGVHVPGSRKQVKVSTKSTAFIRSWHLPSATVKSVPDLRRSDPVTLYHHYQSIWKKQNLPGENMHAELRWSIRERMLGNVPHPRPVSRASSIERYQTKKC